MYFQFVQGDECPRGGYIFYRPGEKEMHNKELIRLWRNRGGIKYLWKDLEENKLDTLKHEKTLLGA